MVVLRSASNAARIVTLGDAAMPKAGRWIR
jgi:hypothetical protein